MSISTLQKEIHTVSSVPTVLESQPFKILAGDIEPTTGHISLGPDERLSVLRQITLTTKTSGSSMLSLWEMKSSTTL